jgi:hypothetical protein
MGNHWRQVIRRANPDFLYAEDLGPPGTKLDVEVTSAKPGKVKNPGESKDVIVLTFKGKQKKLGIGAAGCKAMRKLTGTDDWDGWRGWITLVVIHTEYFDSSTQQREETDAIRIAPQRPRGKGAASSTSGSAPAPDEQAAIARDEAEGR